MAGRLLLFFSWVYVHGENCHISEPKWECRRGEASNWELLGNINGGSNGPHLKDGSFGLLRAEQKRKHTSYPDSYLVITQSPSDWLVSCLVSG